MHIVEQLTAQKNNAYRERNLLIAALSKHYPASLELNPNLTEAANGWMFICFIDLPTGQASWHIADDDYEAFNHLPRMTGRLWDQHTTAEKYERLKQLAPDRRLTTACDLLRIGATICANATDPQAQAFARQAVSFIDRGAVP